MRPRGFRHFRTTTSFADLERRNTSKWGMLCHRTLQDRSPASSPEFYRDRMADIISPQRRSWNMSRIRSSGTAPERKLRSYLHREGFRFVRNQKLPGQPDIVLPRYKAVVFVHGCFWHRHPRCRFAYTPKTNRRFWREKFQDNVERDRRVVLALRKLGWRVYTTWECQIGRDVAKSAARITHLRMGGPRS